jgi:Sugar phosphate permease
MSHQDAVSRATLKRIELRLLPFLGLLYLVSFLDRVNISFAKLTMNADLGFDDSAYALGAGIFFLGYFMFEVPSNLILARVGARRWIARIMITWGLLSAGTAFVTGPTSFIAIRFLLGVAEAGFFPGIILYLTYWFPAGERARVMSLFLTAIPISGLIGSPLSSELLRLDGNLGLHGWQWMLLLEGLPAVFLGLTCLAFLPDGPQDVRWLTAKERASLINVLDKERALLERTSYKSARDVLIKPIIWILCSIYFGVILGLYGLGFWLPTLTSTPGLEITRQGWIVAIPYACGALFMLWWGRRSDQAKERPMHFIISAFIGFAGFATASVIEPPFQLACLCLAAMGIYGCMPIFWTIPAMYLTGIGAAAGIALINSVGNLAGYLGPQVMVWLSADNREFGPALLSLGLALLGSGLILAVTRTQKLRHVLSDRTQDSIQTSGTREVTRHTSS